MARSARAPGSASESTAIRRAPRHGRPPEPFLRRAPRLPCRWPLPPRRHDSAPLVVKFPNHPNLPNSTTPRSVGLLLCQRPPTPPEGGCPRTADGRARPPAPPSPPLRTAVALPSPPNPRKAGRAQECTDLPKGHCGYTSSAQEPRIASDFRAFAVARGHFRDIVTRNP